MNWLLTLSVLLAHAVTEAPLTVEAYKALRISAHQPEPAIVRVKGYLLPGFTCPPCPEGAQCEPCAADTFILSDRKEACATEKKCPHEMPLAKSLLKAPFTPGTVATFEVELNPSYRLVELETSAGRAQKIQNEEIGKGLRDSLKRSPKLVPTKRPGWLKDIPGDSYELKK